MDCQNNNHTAPPPLDAIIIGAGPSGSLAASLLHQQGKRVLVLEKQHFPRFSIGESLLPCCMQILEEANMLEAVNNAGFQPKNGAAFRYQTCYTEFDFREKFSTGPGTTFQVERAKFDKLLADTASKQGVEIRYGQTVEAIDLGDESLVDYPSLSVVDEDGQRQQITAKYILDASGFGRVLPRLLDLERPATLASRCAIFAHIDDHISDLAFDRNKILISVHPDRPDVWYWLIPFSDGRCSVGVVGEPHQLLAMANLTGQNDDPANNSIGDKFSCNQLKYILLEAIAQEPELKKLLANATLISDCNKLQGYSAKVSTLATKQFALLGNAGEFLDPVFSSGVTIAMQSASMAAKTLVRQLDGENVDWQTDYAQPLMVGIDTFRSYVDAWYDTRFQEIIFYDKSDESIKEMICAILAGYAWDQTNPFVKSPQKRLNMLIDYCREYP